MAPVHGKNQTECPHLKGEGGGGFSQFRFLTKSRCHPPQLHVYRVGLQLKLVESTYVEPSSRTMDIRGSSGDLERKRDLPETDLRPKKDTCGWTEAVYQPVFIGNHPSQQARFVDFEHQYETLFKVHSGEPSFSWQASLI